METSEDDRIISSLEEGATLLATKDLIMRESGERSFTTGRAYQVKSKTMRLRPARVMVVNDQGEPHILTGRHVREYFKGYTLD